MKSKGVVVVALLIFLLLCVLLIFCISVSTVYYRQEPRGAVDYSLNSPLSRLRGEEYECSGVCYCEEESDGKDEYMERRISAIGIEKSVSLLLLAASSIMAYQLSKAHFEEQCVEDLSDSCEFSSIRHEVDDCKVITVSESEDEYDALPARKTLTSDRSEAGELEDTLEDDYPDGKTYFVTGATGVIGYQIARLIASEDRSNRVVVIARNPTKAEEAVTKMRMETGNPNIFYEIADLSMKGSIQAFRARWGNRNVDVVVNDHVICPLEREETDDGIEMNMACNVLGYAWMIEEFEDVLSDSSTDDEHSRIVNVVSYWAGRLDLDDLEFQKREYDNVDAYFQCKQAERMLTQYYAKKFKKKKIDVNSSMSGDVDSKCSRDLDCPVPGSPTEAAKTPYKVAVGKLGKGETGEYFWDGRKARKEDYENDWDSINKLYEMCMKY